jgi:hypothetical protein
VCEVFQLFIELALELILVKLGHQTEAAPKAVVAACIVSRYWDHGQMSALEMYSWHDAC